MAGEVEARQPKKGKGLRHQKHRVSIRIDMTPMVDVAFLLLIFFMVTTVFRQPQALEMNLPPPNTVKVPESNVLTLFVDPSKRMFYQVGSKSALTSVTLGELHNLFIDNSKLNPELIILVKLNRLAPYVMMVDIMDELEIADMKRFSLLPMSEEEVQKIGAQI